MNRAPLVVSFTLVLSAFASSAHADGEAPAATDGEHAAPAGHAEPEPAEHETEHEHEHEHHHANHVAVFVGGTTSFGDAGTTHFTVGADYEHRLPFAGHMIGVGALIDAALASTTETIVAPFVAVHPGGGLMLMGAVGVAFTDLGKDGQLALRGAAAYFVPVGTLSIGPEVSVDRVNGETAVVYGVSVGTGF